MTDARLNIEAINSNFFGEEKTHRYLLDIYRDCVEKLILANVLAEVWVRTKYVHEHVQGRNCNQCAVFFQIYYSCVDSLFLHLRLLFSRQEPWLADSFLSAIKNLCIEDFQEYYTHNYGYKISEDEIRAIEPLAILAKDNLAELSKLYIRRVEPYQSFVFHRPEDGKYYEVSTSQKDGEGIKYVTHTLKSKFRRDLIAAKEMLDLLGDVIHLYLKLSSKYYHVLKIYPQNYVEEIIALLGVEVGEEAMAEMVNNATENTKKMVHVLECSGGLNSHNGLQFAKFQSAKEAGNEC